MVIRCPECGKSISDASEQCIHCGYPIQKNPTQGKAVILGSDSAPAVEHKWRCSECGNMISEEPCPYCVARVQRDKREQVYRRDIYIGKDHPNNRRNDSIYSNSGSTSEIQRYSNINSRSGSSVSTGSATPELVKQSIKRKRLFIIVYIIIWIAIILAACILPSMINTPYKENPNRTREYCSYLGEVDVYPSGHIMEGGGTPCYPDGDGYYQPAFGHHHHK